MIVADTNVLSELMRPEPDPAALTWMDRVPGNEFFSTAVTVAEIQYGLARLPPGRRRDSLTDVATTVFASFEDRILAFDTAAAVRYGQLVAERDRAGQPIAMADAQIAAICLVHGAGLATRDVDGFEGTGLLVHDPWEERGPGGEE